VWIISTFCQIRRRRIDILRNAVTKRPVFPCNFDEVDEDIFFEYALLGRQQLGDIFKKRFLLLHRAAGRKSDLDDYNPIGSLDVEIVGIVYQVSLMLII
jgi:hypothetical protein